MPTYIILARSKASAASLTKVLELAACVDGLNLKESCAEPTEILVTESEPGIDTFKRVVGKIQEAVDRGGQVPLCEVVVLVDDVSLAELNPVRSSGWMSVLAMVILSFPEFRWVFGCIRPPVASTDSATDSDSASLMESHSLSSLFAARWEPLFDPSGLRNHIRRLGKQTKTGDADGETGNEPKPLAPYLPLRKRLAVAIDDEWSYAYLNAYTAYRFGYCAHAVMTWGQMEWACKRDRKNGEWLTIEDLHLNFADRPDRAENNKRLSNLIERDSIFPALGKQNVKFRILVTSGQTRASDPAKWQANRAYMEEKWGSRAKLIPKPFSGIFDLKKEAELEPARGFVWPPERLASDDSPAGHSAPGRLMEVAHLLIERAAKLASQPATLRDAIHGALLATEAVELLGNRAPTTSLEALSLKQQFEALAECQFYGVQQNFDVKSRFKDVYDEVDSIGHWFQESERNSVALNWRDALLPRLIAAAKERLQKSERQIAVLNAKEAILSRLITVFRGQNQFDEEQDCQAEFRKLSRSLWFARHPALRVTLLLPLLRWYADTLLGSLRVFITAIMLWLAGLTGLLWILDKKGPAAALVDAVTAFFGGQPPDGATGWSLGALVFFGVFAGFAHLGIFVSYLYSVASRK